MIDIKIPDLNTKLSYDIDIPGKVSKWSIEGKVLDLRDSLGQKIKVWKKLSDHKVVCLGKQDGKEVQYTFEIENIKGNQNISSALNTWMYAKEESENEIYDGKDLNFYEKVYYSDPRLYEVRVNSDVFKLNLRFAKLTEMGRDLLLEKKREVKRFGRIHTLMKKYGFLDELLKLSFERTIESNETVCERFFDDIIHLCVSVELDPPKPIEPPFYFRVAEIGKIGEHFIKLTKQRGREENDLLSIDSLDDFLSDGADEIITHSEMKEVQAKMKRKIRKIAREFWKENHPEEDAL